MSDRIHTSGEAFQAKEIQEILKMQRFRYDYLILKIGINPDIVEASGRGKTNIFSFQKLMDFAIANCASEMGMAPRLIQWSISQIHKWSDITKSQYFNNINMNYIEKFRGIFFHTASIKGSIFSCFSGNINIEFKRADFWTHQDKLLADEQSDYFKLENPLDIANSYMTLNLYKIKKDVHFNLA